MSEQQINPTLDLFIKFGIGFIVLYAFLILVCLFAFWILK